MLTEEETLFMIQTLRERRRRTLFNTFTITIERERTEKKLIGDLVDKLIASLPGKWWVQRHGGATNHDWKTLFETTSFCAASARFDALKAEAKRGGVSLMYRPAAQRLGWMEAGLFVANENDKERIYRKRKKS